MGLMSGWVRPARVRSSASKSALFWAAVFSGAAVGAPPAAALLLAASCALVLLRGIEVSVSFSSSTFSWFWEGSIYAWGGGVGGTYSNLLGRGGVLYLVGFYGRVKVSVGFGCSSLKFGGLGLRGVRLLWPCVWYCGVWGGGGGWCCLVGFGGVLVLWVVDGAVGGFEFLGVGQ